MSTDTSIRKEDYPCRFRRVDEKANEFQKRHYSLVATELIILVIISVIISLLGSGWGFLGIKGSNILITVAFLVILFLGVRLYREKSDYDSMWYKARSLAETIKSITWQYMMRVNRYGGSKEKATEQFLEDLEDISEKRREILSKVDPTTKNKNEVTQKMDVVRSLSLKDRIYVYNSERLNDQIDWYDSKINAYQESQKQWNKVTVIAGVCTIILTLVAIELGSKAFGFVPPFLVVITAVSSWSRANRFSSLVESYNLTRQELSAIENHAPPQDEENFAEQVHEVENTISKEHTMWMARRGNMAVRNQLYS